MAKVIKGSFSEKNGSAVRIIRDQNGSVLGTITKLESGNYRIWRLKDSKIRVKKYLSEAMKSVSRAN